MSTFNKYTLCYSIGTNKICAISAYTLFSFFESLNIYIKMWFPLFLNIYNYVHLSPCTHMSLSHQQAWHDKMQLFALYCLFERAVSTNITVSEVITVPDKILCLQMPQLHPSPVHQQSQHWSCKLCILSLSLSKLGDQFQQTLIGLVLECIDGRDDLFVFVVEKRNLYWWSRRYICIGGRDGISVLVVETIYLYWWSRWYICIGGRDGRDDISVLVFETIYLYWRSGRYICIGGRDDISGLVVETIYL